MNRDINIDYGEEWYGNLLDGIAAHRALEREVVEARAQSVLARSEAIRYVQLGNPELIVVDDGNAAERVEKARGRHRCRSRRTCRASKLGNVERLTGAMGTGP